MTKIQTMIKTLFYLWLNLYAFALSAQVKNCNTNARISLPSILKKDSLHMYRITVDANNFTDTSLVYENLYGQKYDTTVFCSLEIYKRTLLGYTKKYKIITEKSRTYTAENGEVLTILDYRSNEVIRPLSPFGIRLSLEAFFDVKREGHYLLKGYYNAICNGKRCLKRTNDVYFVIK
jgi:hypothetical protein